MDGHACVWCAWELKIAGYTATQCVTKSTLLFPDTRKKYQLVSQLKKYLRERLIRTYLVGINTIFSTWTFEHWGAVKDGALQPVDRRGRTCKTMQQLVIQLLQYEIIKRSILPTEFLQKKDRRRIKYIRWAYAQKFYPNTQCVTIRVPRYFKARERNNK
jgi:hypothetical protein